MLIRDNGELQQRRFWAMYVNRKRVLFHFKSTWHCDICISKCLYYHRDYLSKKLGKTIVQNWKKMTTSGWRASLKNMPELPNNFSSLAFDAVILFVFIGHFLLVFFTVCSRFSFFTFFLFSTIIIFLNSLLFNCKRDTRDSITLHVLIPLTHSLKYFA